LKIHLNIILPSTSGSPQWRCHIAPVIYIWGGDTSTLVLALYKIGGLPYESVYGLMLPEQELGTALHIVTQGIWLWNRQIKMTCTNKWQSTSSCAEYQLPRCPECFEFPFSI
jgi:hypothetical protein